MTNAAAVKEVMPPVLKVCELTHGTLEVRDLAPSREFYEDVLGLRCVRHAPVALLIGGEGGTCIVGVKAANRTNEQGAENRWLICVGSDKRVEELHLRAQSRGHILDLGEISSQDGVTSFRVQDGDGNWWEVSSRSESHFQKYFEQGDIG